MPLPRNTLLALLICFFGIGLLDQLLETLRQYFLSMRGTDLPPALSFESFARIGRINRWAGYAGLCLLWLLALMIARPHGITRDEFLLLLAFAVAFTLGRSFLGVGEGFTLSFLTLNLICGGVAITLQYLLLARRG